MGSPEAMSVGCQYLSEYTDDAETDVVEFRSQAPVRAENVHPKRILIYLDVVFEKSTSA